MRKLLAACGLAFALFLAPAFGQVDDRENGIEMYRVGNYSEAAAILQSVVEADPKDKVAWTYLGGSLVHLDRADEAVKAFRKPVGGPKYDAKFDKELKIIKRERAGYTQEARTNHVSGTVVLVVEFKADGTIGFVVPIQSLPFGLTDNSIASVRSMKFSPPEKNGKPVSVIRMISTQFDIY